MAPSEERKPPKMLGGYELLEKIGQGGMGAVFRARQISMDRIVAVKILPRKLAREETFKERFFREARAVGRLNHPNIVAAIDAQEQDGVCYLAMEFVKGYSLGDRIKKEGALPEDEALNITYQIAQGLDHAWESGFVHRDVKPENFLYTNDGVAKLCDLGIAKAQSDGSLTQSGKAIGTPKYISPEQARGIDDVDLRADIYSLGASLYHMIAGCPPFEAETAAAVMVKHLKEEPEPVRARNPAASRFSEAILQKMLAKDPNDRYQTAAELLADLEDVIDGRPPRSIPGLGRGLGEFATARDLLPFLPNWAAAVIGTVLLGGGLLVLILLATVPPPEDADDPKDPSPTPGPVVDEGALVRERERLEQERREQAAAALDAAEALFKKKQYEQALTQYRAWLDIYEDLPAAESAQAMIGQIEQTLARLEAEARENKRQIAANKAWDGLLESFRRERMHPRAQLEAMKRFREDWPNTEVLGRSARRIEKTGAKLRQMEALAASVGLPAGFSPDADQILQAKRVMKSKNWAQAEPILHVMEQNGETLAELASEAMFVSRLGPEARLRQLATRALARTSPALFIDELHGLLIDRNEGVRLEAVRMIRELPEVPPPVRRMLKQLSAETPPLQDPSPIVRQAAIETLQSLPE